MATKRVTASLDVTPQIPAIKEPTIVDERAKVALLSEGWSPGLMHVGTAAKEVADVKIFDVRRVSYSQLEDFAKGIREYFGGEPNVVGVQLFQPSDKEPLFRLQQLKQYLPGSNLVVGGSQVTNEGIQAVIASGADFGFIGASEESFRRFLKIIGSKRRGELTIEQWRELLDITGLVFNYGGRWYGNFTSTDAKGRPFVKQKNEFRQTMVDWGLGHELMMIPEKMRGPKLSDKDMEWDAITYTTFIGCPYNCVYCTQPGGKGLAKPAGTVLQDLDNMADFLGERMARGVIVTLGDNDLLLDQRRVMNIFGGLKQRPYSEHLWLTFFANAKSFYKGEGICTDVMDALGEKIERGGVRGKSPRVYAIGLGTESLSESRLERMRAPHRNRHTLQVAGELSSAGINQNHFMIMSDVDITPSEQMEDLIGMHRLKSIDPDIMFQWAKSMIPYRGSDYFCQLRDRFGEEGMWGQVTYDKIVTGGVEYRLIKGSKILDPAANEAHDSVILTSMFSTTEEIEDTAKRATDVYSRHLSSLRSDDSRKWDDEKAKREDNLETAIETTKKYFGWGSIS